MAPVNADYDTKEDGVLLVAVEVVLGGKSQSHVEDTFGIVLVEISTLRLLLHEESVYVDEGTHDDLRAHVLVDLHEKFEKLEYLDL